MLLFCFVVVIVYAWIFCLCFSQKQSANQGKKYRGMLYYLIEKHMQKFRHFWRKVEGSSDLGSSPHRGHYAVFLHKQRHFTLKGPFSTLVCKWIPAKLLNAGGNPVMNKYPIKGGVEILLVVSCYWTQDVVWPDGPLDSYADFTM